jgi:hypothetical protein
MTILPRRDIEEKWLNINPILHEYELACIETKDGIKYKLGDGKTEFKNLKYLNTLDGLDYFKIYNNYVGYNNIFNITTVYLNPFAYDN